MPFLLYDYLSAQGANDFRAWTEDLQPTDRGRLNQKLDMLKQNGEELLPNTLTGSGVAGIYKLRVHGPVQLRPLLCKGPVHKEEAFTLLVGAIEKGGVLKPKGVAAIADNRKTEVKQDPANRRKPHERIA